MSFKSFHVMLAAAVDIYRYIIDKFAAQYCSGNAKIDAALGFGKHKMASLSSFFVLRTLH
jgi:hypothetical protein